MCIKSFTFSLEIGGLPRPVGQELKWGCPLSDLHCVFGHPHQSWPAWLHHIASYPSLPRILHLLAWHQDLLRAGLLVLWNFGSHPGNLAPCAHSYYLPLNNCSGFSLGLYSSSLIFWSEIYLSRESEQPATCIRSPANSLLSPKPRVWTVTMYCLIGKKISAVKEKKKIRKGIQFDSFKLKLIIV